MLWLVDGGTGGSGLPVPRRGDYGCRALNRTIFQCCWCQASVNTVYEMKSELPALVFFLGAIP